MLDRGLQQFSILPSSYRSPLALDDGAVDVQTLPHEIQVVALSTLVDIDRPSIVAKLLDVIKTNGIPVT